MELYGEGGVGGGWYMQNNSREISRFSFKNVSIRRRFIVRSPTYEFLLNEGLPHRVIAGNSGERVESLNLRPAEQMKPRLRVWNDIINENYRTNIWECGCYVLLIYFVHCFLSFIFVYLVYGRRNINI